MRRRFGLPVVVLSVLAAIAFAAQWIQEQNRVYQLVIATGGKDGEYYAFAEALAVVVDRHHPNIQITVLATEGSPQNLELLEQGKAQLAIVQSDTPTKPSARAVAYLFPEVFHLLARSDSGIRSVNDLRGKRVALMPKGSGSYALFWAMGQHYRLSESTFTPVVLPPNEAYAALRQGRVDALFRVIALGNPSMGELLQSSRSQLIAIDQVDALRLSLPYLEATHIPKGTYDGAVPTPTEDLPVVGVRAVLVSHTDVNPAVVQDITQTLFEFRNEIVSIYPRAAMIRLPDSMENLGLPLHSGAKAYYEHDQPGFLIEYAEPIGLLLSVSVLAVSGLWQFRLWLAGRQKNRADTYNLEIMALIDRMQIVEDLRELEQVRLQLFEILRKVVIDLDNDRITPESFQSFMFPWEVAITTLRHQEMILVNMRLRQERLSEISS
ncbi:MAG: TAXI family TRAP transporter solute-binding subunit [Cyanobacteria bacterium CRU_2_1]|nr:TAXI family TRAP transporter solute-binding subunit [Cyanobacteria bacterium RU_5_0]NJR58300.1 TAXI family TRAP transporter solute-binding subunit [Cyanobacteria bacterium CRU_2_1]